MPGGKSAEFVNQFCLFVGFFCVGWLVGFFIVISLLTLPSEKDWKKFLLFSIMASDSLKSHKKLLREAICVFDN